MFNKRLRILALSIVILLTTSLFAACTEDASSTETASVVASETASQTRMGEIESVQTDFLGSYDFKGITIKIGSTSKNFLFPETTTTALDEHKAKIVQDTAARFNVKLEHVDLTYGEFSKEVLPDLLAGDLVAHIIMPVIWEAGVLVTAGVCTDYKTPELSEYINFDNPWWDSKMEYASTINGKTYCATPNFTSAVDYTYVMFFNKKIAADENITDLYDLEKNKEWTWDKFREYAKKGVKDLNGDGQYSLDDDRWGFLTPMDSMDAFLTGAKCRTIEVDASGKATYSLNTARNIEIMSTINEIYTKDGIYTNTTNVDSMDKYFVEGKTLFAAYQLQYLKNDKMRDMADDYGVLLMPLGPDQTEYMSRVNHNASCVVIPTTNNDTTELQATAVVLEGLAFATWKLGVPDIIDLYSVQYTKDEGSIWAIENVFNCTTYETTQLLYMIGNPTWGFMMESQVINNSLFTAGSDISGTVTAIADAAQKYIDDLWASNNKQ